VIAAVIICQIQASPKVQLMKNWNLVGAGARALGMGGAFIAIADDVTAA